MGATLSGRTHPRPPRGAAQRPCAPPSHVPAGPQTSSVNLATPQVRRITAPPLATIRRRSRRRASAARPTGVGRRGWCGRGAQARRNPPAPTAFGAAARALSQHNRAPPGRWCEGVSPPTLPPTSGNHTLPAGLIAQRFQACSQAAAVGGPGFRRQRLCPRFPAAGLAPAQQFRIVLGFFRAFSRAGPQGYPPPHRGFP